MHENVKRIMVCPKCRSGLSERRGKLICSRGHKFEIDGTVPVMAELDPYLENEAKAWEDSWKRGVGKRALSAYKKNMKVFERLGYWEESGRAARIIKSKKNWHVLDLGCGNGFSTANIKGSVVVGMDLSRKQMVRASKRYKNTFFVVGDAACLPFRSGTFDLVVAINLFHHLRDKKEAALREAYRVLKKGGVLLAVDPNLTNPIGFTGRGLFKLLGLKKIFPTFPQFALGDDEKQFTKAQYYEFFEKSPFKKFKIIPHRIERILFFATILLPPLSKLPGYESFLVFVSRAGERIVKIPPFDHLCYFWKAEAVK